MRAWFWTSLIGVVACAPPVDGRDPSGRNDPADGVIEPPNQPPDEPPVDDPPVVPPDDPPAEGCDAGGDDAARMVCATGAVAVAAGQPFDGLQAAIDAASDGTTVWLCPGDSNESVEIDRRQLRIEAALPGFGRLDGENQRRLLRIVDSEVVLRGFDVRRGRQGTDGGAIRIRESTVALECMTLSESVSSLAGGAVSATESALRIEDVVFRNNEAQVGGAVRVIGTPNDGPAVFRRVSFDNNDANAGGGALAVGGSASDVVLLEDVTFDRNQAGTRGGALAVLGEFAPSVTIVRGEFDNNDAPQWGGAVYVDHAGAADVTFQATELEDNEAPFGAAVGASNRIEGGVITFVDATINDNEANPSNGAIQTEDDDVSVVCTNCDLGEGVFDNQPHDVVVQDTTFDGGDEVNFILPAPDTSLP